MDAIATFKESQRKSWPSFRPLEWLTTVSAARLVDHAGVRSGQRVLDVACGTGVVAVTAARRGCQVTGLDLTPELLERARENGELAEVTIDWHEGDAEELPFRDAQFDVVLSQFGHIFAPRPQVAIAQMLRVLKPGGTIAFSTWPPELYQGSNAKLMQRYLPPPPEGVSLPMEWGDPHIVRERLGAAVEDIVFERDILLSPALSPRHYRVEMEKASPNLQRVLKNLAENDPTKLAQFNQEYESLVSQYFKDNVVRMGYLLTRAKKR
jgi:SAM-dependent methyltransferase